MNTDAEPSPRPSEAGGTPPTIKPISEVLARGTDAASPLPVDESAAALEFALQREIDERREERFYWILVCAFFIDLATFPHLSWIAVLCIFLLQVVALVGLAKKFGNEYVVILMERLFQTICDKIGLGKSS